MSAAGLVVGSPGFMSPEQAMGEEIGPPSDIFSLGAVLTFAATGGGPFGKGSSPELAYRLVYRPPDLGLLPAELRPLVESCLAKDPGQRPTAAEVLATTSAIQPATGWMADAALGAFGPYISPSPASGSQAVPAGWPEPDRVAAADGGRGDGDRARGVGRGQLRPGRSRQALYRRAVGAEGHRHADLDRSVVRACDLR